MPAQRRGSAMPKKHHIDPAAELEKAFARWDDIYENGCNDPFWPDGTNLELTRNHIIYYRALLEETPTLFGFPEIYNREVPPEVPQSYMARPDEIRAAAGASLEAYRADPDYQFIVDHREEIPEKMRGKLSVDVATRYVAGLELAIAKDNLVDMRRHECPDNYLDSFGSCAQGMRDFLSDGMEPVDIHADDETEDEGFEEEPGEDLDEDFGEEPEQEFGGMTMKMQ